MSLLESTDGLLSLGITVSRSSCQPARLLPQLWLLRFSVCHGACGDTYNP